MIHLNLRQVQFPQQDLVTDLPRLSLPPHRFPQLTNGLRLIRELPTVVGDGPTPIPGLCVVAHSSPPTEIEKPGHDNDDENRDGE